MQFAPIEYLSEVVMGDRFYQQQLKATGNCPGNPKDKGKAPKALTKAEKVDLLGIKGLLVFTQAELSALLLVWDTTPNLSMPEGAKKHFVEEAQAITPEVNWGKCTKVTLIEVINKFLEEVG